MFLLSVLINNITFPSARLLKADISVGFLIYRPILFFAVLFFGVWIIEALVIRKRLGGSPKKILLASFMANLITTLVGVFIYIVGILEYLIDILDNLLGPIVFIFFVILMPFFLSVMVEAIILLFFYREKPWKEIFKTSIWMNGKSYLFIVAFLILDALMLTFLLVVVLIPWGLIKFFNILSKNEKLSKNKKILVTLLASIIIAVIIFGGIKWPDSRRSYARDARKMADLRQIHLAMEMYYNEHQKYLQSEVMPTTIDDYLNPVPQDPIDGPYHWISNVSDPEKYCVWVHLENGNYFAASHKGTKEIDNPPNSLDCY